MTVKLQFERMKIAHEIVVDRPSDFDALQTLAFNKAWECVEAYFKSLGEPLPKQRHGKPSHACIRCDLDDIHSDADLQSSLEKGKERFR